MDLLSLKHYSINAVEFNPKWWLYCVFYFNTTDSMVGPIIIAELNLFKTYIMRALHFIFVKERE